MDQIKQEPEDQCIYKRMFLSWKTGLNKIYTEKEIELQRQSPSFEKEYNLRFEYGVGNVFHYEDIDAAIEPYQVQTDNPYATRFIGLDPAWGSSKFGVVVVEWFDNTFRVLYADSWERPLFNDAIEKVIALAQTYNCCKIFCDGANPSVIQSLKKYYGSSEFMEYQDLKPEAVCAS